MITIVIVSHSQKLAMGLKEIAEQISANKVKIVAAGGLENDQIGTDPILIKNVIEECSEAENILIFVDLGSAVISSEMAIDLLDDELRKKVKIVDAPIVEGVIFATIQGSITDDIESIIENAKNARNLSKFKI